MARVSEGWHEYEPLNGAGFMVQDAPLSAVDFVLKQSTASNDGRSQWVWIRLQDGNLVLAVYPQGDTYLATEQWRMI